MNFNNVKYINLEYRSVWKSEKKGYQDVFSDNKIFELRLEILFFSEDFSQQKIDAIASELANIIVEPANRWVFVKNIL